MKRVFLRFDTGVLIKVRKWRKLIEIVAKGLTVLGRKLVDEERATSSELKAWLEVDRKTENRKFLERSCAEIKSTTRQSTPKVSAVSWITNKTFKLYKCCQSVKEKGSLSAVQE